MKKIIIVAGYIARYPLGGGRTSFQYVLGLKKLGYDVYFFEESGWPQSFYDPEKKVMTSDFSYGLNYLGKLMEGHGLKGRWVVVDLENNYHGMGKQEAKDLLKDSDLLLNISGICWSPELGLCKKRVFIDLDPPFTQIKALKGKLKNLKDYHFYFTIGQNIGKPGCSVPTLGLDWRVTKQPVVLELWKFHPDLNSTTFTTVMNWNSYDSLEFCGKIYGQKGIEFLKFIELPQLSTWKFEIALAGGNAPTKEIILEKGWKIVNAAMITKDFKTYQDYIYQSRAEFSVAKNGYVEARCGWIGDRDVLYLASGKPVILQDTGFREWLPVGKGLIPFSSMEEILKGIEDMDANYLAHCRAARSIAEEYFDSNKVLGRLLEEVSI